MAPGKLFKGRPLHQTTFSLGDQKPSYSTTHIESFCGRSKDAQPLVFYLRDPSYPSQHQCKLDLRNISKGSTLSSTHSRDIHCPKDITPPDILRALRDRNRALNRQSQAMKEVTNPPGGATYRSSYRSDHCAAETSLQDQQASGQATCWHRHDILTGEERPPAGPRELKKKHVVSKMGASRRREDDCTALRLY
ncbi:hypothetical protein HF521_004216 [Silurus meridionalis]|uniref:Uncharacterized protein n=1 Tax=Silurus meridionalis TaxID=175797 RepID=A0A8T0AXN7_SILME|nr:hypothetical protein HF521_004216 [Silurus meridionalis]